MSSILTPSESSDQTGTTPSIALEGERIGDEVGFALSSNRDTGRLLRCVAAMKPGCHAIEVGGGLAVGAAWMLDGMDSNSRLVTIEIHPEAAEYCRRLLAEEARATVVEADAVVWLESYSGPQFDIAFVDTTTVKFERLDLLIDLMAPGAILVADDLLPQPKWTEDHVQKVAKLRSTIESHSDLHAVLVDWGSGILLASKRAA